MKTEMCLVVFFLVGVLLFFLLKQSCGCNVVEGLAEYELGRGPFGPYADSYCYDNAVKGDTPWMWGCGPLVDGQMMMLGVCQNIFNEVICGNP